MREHRTPFRCTLPASTTIHRPAFSHPWRPGFLPSATVGTMDIEGCVAILLFRKMYVDWHQYQVSQGRLPSHRQNLRILLFPSGTTCSRTCPTGLLTITATGYVEQLRLAAKCLRTSTVADAPPEEGEEWNVIADDYQKLILPGTQFSVQPRFSSRIDCAKA